MQGDFQGELEKVWRHAHRVLVPGGRLVCVVGDVCLSRRENAGRHVVVPLHADICVQCRKIGFDNLNPIIWHKIANASYEVSNGSKFLGKPYEPNAIIKNDIEFILMQRKPGGYRRPTEEQREQSKIAKDDFNKWFQQFWTITGASTKEHPAPFPVELAHRLVRMFSFVGDTVLDPFVGTGTTMVAAMSGVEASVTPGGLVPRQPGAKICNPVGIDWRAEGLFFFFASSRENDLAQCRRGAEKKPHLDSPAAPPSPKASAGKPASSRE